MSASVTQDSFGNFLSTSGSSTNPYIYGATSGYRTDNYAGLILVGARYYDAQVGAFITRDTDLSQKPYQYCNHDPVNNVDPSGHGDPTDIWNEWNFVINGESVMNYFHQQQTNIGLGPLPPLNLTPHDPGLPPARGGHAHSLPPLSLGKDGLTFRSPKVDVTLNVKTKGLQVEEATFTLGFHF